MPLRGVPLSAVCQVTWPLEMPTSHHATLLRGRYLAVAQKLLTSIQEDRYRPGDRLPSEPELAEQMGVSCPTAHESILALELVGVINVRHGDGAYVAKIKTRTFAGKKLDSASNPQELMEARITLEPPVSALLTRHTDESGLRRIQDDLDEAAVLIDDLSALPTFVCLALRFHAQLAELCENRILKGLISELVDMNSQPLSALFNQMALRTRASRISVVEDHQMILDSMRAGDPQVVEGAMRTHLHSNLRLISTEDTITSEVGAIAHR